MQHHALLAAVCDCRDHRRERNDACWKTVHAKYGVHQRTLAATEPSDHHEVEAVFGKPAEQVANVGRQLAAVGHRARRSDPYDVGQIEFQSLVLLHIQRGHSCGLANAWTYGWLGERTARANPDE
jgi:hypothetical protein